MSADKFNLRRFVQAQEPIIEVVRAELCRGVKETHWMWFVFPQLVGLGLSPRANFFGLRHLEEAQGYLAHTVLGPRLQECVDLVLSHRGSSAEAIFGNLDAMKFRSSMTLFAKAKKDEPIFQSALDVFFGGEGDDVTLSKLKIAKRK